MPTRRLLQLGGIALTGALLTTQGMARSETVSSSASGATNDGPPIAYVRPPQDASQHALPAGANPLPLVIDGSKTPELISDSMAFGHFVRATLVPTESPEEALTRQRLMLAPLQLSDPDRGALLQAIGVVRENLDRIETQRRAVSKSGADGKASARRLSNEEAQLLGGARGHLNAALTPAGASRLDAHLRNEVKRRIKVYGDLAR